MIQSVTQEEMERLLQKEHPAWTSRAIFNEATQLLQGLDNRFEPFLRTYLDTGKMTDYTHGEFSLFLIRGLRRNCSYLQAVLLMDTYLKNPRNGRALILRR